MKGEAGERCGAVDFRSAVTGLRLATAHDLRRSDGHLRLRCRRWATSRCSSPTIPRCGYFGIIAIHDTTLGPALGGTRFWQYASTDEAITDALRLARGMTYKSAVAGINLGGGKSVIIGDNKRADREALFRAHGRFIETLGGRYITAEDIGTSPADMEYIKLETDHVAGPARPVAATRRR